jgi:hypothetical protein
MSFETNVTLHNMFRDWSGAQSKQSPIGRKFSQYGHPGPKPKPRSF